MLTLNGRAINLTSGTVLSIRLDKGELEKKVDVASVCLIVPRTEVKYYTDDATNFLGICTQACLSCPARINQCESYYLPPSFRV